MVVKCPHCDSPIAALTATCPYCYAALRPWSRNSPWVLPALVAFLCLLLGVIVVDKTADLGILKWCAEQIKPKAEKKK